MKAQNIIIVTRKTIAISLLILISTMQSMAVEYRNSYRSTRSQSAVYGMATTVAAPTASFHSTSAYAEKWGTNTDVTPMLNNDGSVSGSAYMGSISNAPAGPRQAPGGPGTPGGDLDPETQQPLGDALIPLLLLAFAYAIYKVSRRRAGEQIAGQ